MFSSWRDGMPSSREEGEGESDKRVLYDSAVELNPNSNYTTVIEEEPDGRILIHDRTKSGNGAFRMDKLEFQQMLAFAPKILDKLGK